MVAYYSNRLSYKEVEDLVKRISGEKILSDQKIWEIVANKAIEISSKWEQEIVESQQKITKAIEIAPTVDIYEAQAQEILLFVDEVSPKG